MKLYLLSQDDFDGYDTYDSCIVCAENEDDAKLITPSSFLDDDIAEGYSGDYGAWPRNVDGVRCEYLGEAKDGSIRGLVLSSFNAG